MDGLSVRPHHIDSGLRRKVFADTRRVQRIDRMVVGSAQRIFSPAGDVAAAPIGLHCLSSRGTVWKSGVRFDRRAGPLPDRIRPLIARRWGAAQPLTTVHPSAGMSPSQDEGTPHAQSLW